MSLTVYSDLEQRSPEWYAARCGIVTASVVGQLLTVRTLEAHEYACPACGADIDLPCISKRGGAPIKTLHPERTAKAAANRKWSPLVIEVADNDTARGVTDTLVAERITGTVEESFVNNDMMRGILHEPVARQRYADHYGVEVAEVGFMARTLDGAAKLGASPDGLIGDDGGLEIKCPRAKTHIQTIVRDEVPARHMAQVQASLFVSGRAWWDFVSFCAGQPMWTKRVYPDPRWHQAIAAAVVAFEKAATETVSAYFGKCSGLPETEPIPDLDELVI